MSLQNVKDAFLDAKKTEINGIEKGRLEQLRSLYCLTKLVGESGVAAFLEHGFLHAPPSPTESRWLEQNDISSGRLFNDSSLPYPSPKTVAPVQSSEAQALIPSEQVVSQVQSPLSPAAESNAKAAIPIDPAQLTPASASSAKLPLIKSTIPPPHTPPRSPNVAVFGDNAQNGLTETSALMPDVVAQENTVQQPTGTISPESAGEEQEPQLPIEDGSGEADVEVKESGGQKELDGIPDRDRDRGKARAEPSLNPANDAASSPSSTAGAYSTSTPKPAAHSPDTSPEADVPLAGSTDFVESSPQAVETVSPVEAPKGTLEDALVSTSPNDQLRSEEAQAQKPSVDEEAKVSGLDDATYKRIEATVARIFDAPQGPEVVSVDADVSTVPDEVTEEETSQAKKPSEEQEKAVNQPTSTDDVEMRDVDSSQPTQVAAPIQQQRHQPSSPEVTPSRMRTRMASGAIRQKSISEILGETPRKSPQTPSTPQVSNATKLGSAIVLPDESSHHKMPTVVFSKDVDPTTAKALRNELEGYLALKGASLDPEKDYLRPLFLHQAWGPPRSQYIQELITRAQKTIGTSDHIASLREQQDYKIIRRIYNLQNANKWSLRQMAKYQDPTPPACHWDHLLDEMKWMRTDFREERRWKIQLARNLAEICAEYHHASDKVKQEMRVKAKRPTVETEKVIADSFDDTPELIPSSSTESSIADDEDEPSVATVSPSAIFSLDVNQVIFHLDHTPSGDALLAELPLYDPKADGLQPEASLPRRPNDSIVPVSKYVTGKLVPKISGIPKKRSRYEYEQSDDEPHIPRQTHKRTKSSDPSPFLSPARRSSPRAEIPPEEQEVALFNPINRHILDRLHTTHAFRPPNEFPMPSVAYFEARPQSQWTWDEDQRLRHWVRKYIYNWSLIAMELQSQCQSSEFVSGAERRTPWECFERWVQLEGLPAEMSKTAYFKAYQGRLETATATLQSRVQIGAQQAASSAAQTPVQANFLRQRRTSHQPVKVERRRDTRHISVIDAMKKIAKRRENAAQRQADTTKAAEMRKSAQVETNQNRPTIYTPQELSRFRQDKEAQLRDREREHAARQQKSLAEQQRAMVSMQRAGQNQAAAGMQQQPAQNMAIAGQTQGIRAPTTQTTPATTQPQLAQAIAQPRVTNGLSAGAISAHSMAGLTQQQIQVLQQQGRLPAQANAAEMTRIAAIQQQRQFQMQLPAQTPGLAAAHLSPTGGMQQNQQHMLANFQRNNLGMNGVNGVNGMNGVSMSSAATGNGNNPHISQQHTNPQAAALAGIMTNLQQQYPHLSPDQVRILAMDRFKGQLRNNIQLSALQAASGSPASAMQSQALAQQHLGLHGHSNAQMMAFAAAQNALGNSSSPNPAAATLAQNSLTGANGMGVSGGLSSNGLTAAGAINSPTQMYRNMHAAQARLSGSPGMMPARPDSRAGTPIGMVRSASGTSGSPTLGSGLVR